MTDDRATTPKRRPDWAALVIAAGLAALAAIVGWDAQRLGDVASYARIGPQTIPYGISMCLSGLAVWTGIEAWEGMFPEREPQELKPVLWIVAGLVLQIVFIRIAGFSIATGLMFACVARGFGERRIWLSLPAGIIVSALVWIIFARLLQLSLPSAAPENALRAAFDAVAALTRPAAGAP